MGLTLPWRPVGINGGPPISTSLTGDETDALRELAQDKMVLEIGGAYGYSAIIMARTAKHVFSIDPHSGLMSSEIDPNRDSLHDMRINLERYGYQKKVTVMLGLSNDILPKLSDIGARFDLIFVDGDHSRHAVKDDVVWSWSMIKRGGVLAAHDYHEVSCPGVAEAIDSCRFLPSEGHRLVDTLYIVGK